LALNFANQRLASYFIFAFISSAIATFRHTSVVLVYY
jgi:hypothetical protein